MFQVGKIYKMFSEISNSVITYMVVERGISTVTLHKIPSLYSEEGKVNPIMFVFKTYLDTVGEYIVLSNCCELEQRLYAES